LNDAIEPGAEGQNAQKWLAHVRRLFTLRRAPMEGDIAPATVGAGELKDGGDVVVARLQQFGLLLRS
jgi:hypothetical protein